MQSIPEIKTEVRKVDLHAGKYTTKTSIRPQQWTFFLYDFSVSDPLSTSFSRQLKAFRGEMSYAQFARKLGISKSSAHKLETAGESTTLKTVYKLACALGCSVEELLGVEAVNKKRTRRG